MLFLLILLLLLSPFIKSWIARYQMSKEMKKMDKREEDDIIDN